MKKIILLSLLSLLFVPLLANASLNTNLYFGLQQNSDVKQLQEFLIDKGFLSGNATGNFFSLTLKAVKQYQASQNINQTGYVGVLTRTAINTDLDTQLQGSNAESTAETGSIPPTPTPPATTNDVVSSLQAQIALLQQQLDALNGQQATVQQLQQTVQQQNQTIQQIQQNTQQIAQNTTAPICTPNWECSAWSSCSNSTQTRTCSDANSCKTGSGEPSLTQSCSVTAGLLTITNNNTNPVKITPPLSQQLLGSFNLTYGGTDSININSVQVNLNSMMPYVKNLFFTFNGNNANNKQGIIATPTATNNFPMNYLLAGGKNLQIDVYGDITSQANTSDNITLLISGITTGSSTLITSNANVPFPGSNISFVPGSLTATFSGSPASFIATKGKEQTVGIYNLTSQYDSYAIQEVRFTVNANGNQLNNSSAISDAVLVDGSTPLGTAYYDATDGYFRFQNLYIPVPMNGTVPLTLAFDIAPDLSSLNISSIDITPTLSYVKAMNSSGNIVTSGIISGSGTANDITITNQ